MDFKIGDIVTITDKKRISYGQVGKVIDTYDKIQSLKIRFLDWKGLGNKECFIHASNVKAIDREQACKHSYQIALVRFINDIVVTKNYAFKLYDDSINVGNLVVVDTVYGFKIAKVVDILNIEDYSGVEVTKDVVCKIDLTQYQERKNIQEKRAEIKKRIDQMLIESLDNSLFYQIVAEGKPEMKKLLNEYERLSLLV